MEIVNCELCGANDTELVYEEKDRLHGVEGTFDLVRCQQCGLMYLSPRPTSEEMRRYYPGSYGPHQPIHEGSSRFARLEQWHGVRKLSRAVIAQSQMERGRVLDIGCSTGAFLDAMRRQGWEPYGLDTNVAAVRYAREHRELDVFAGRLQEAEYPSDFFDVVTLWNVFEHLHHPRVTLAEIGRVIQRKGLLVISIPNPDSLEARVFGRYWAGLDAPRHLYLFSRHTLERLLALTGFELQDVRSFTGHHPVLALSMGFWLDEKVDSDRWRRCMKATVESLAVRVLTLPYYAIADRVNQSSVMTVFARRRKELE